MDEFAMGSSTENSAYGPTKNPKIRLACRAALPAVRPPRSPRGFATSRSARTRAARFASRPRYAVALVLNRPTVRFRAIGLMAMASSLDVIGPLANSVADARFVFDAIRGADES